MISADKFRGVFAIVPACATHGAQSAGAKDTFDKTSFSELVDRLVRDGVHGILTTGSIGECHTLLWEEHRKLIDTVVDVVNGRVPVVTGTSSLNTREVIMKTKYAEEAGADAIMNGVPMYLQLSLENVIQYYKDIAEACPNIGIMIYSNPKVFRVLIPPDAFTKLKEIPNIVAVKETLDRPFHELVEVCKVCGDEISVLPLDSMMIPAMMFGAKGCWSESVCMGPQPVLRLYEACAKKDWETAIRIRDDITAVSRAARRLIVQANLDWYMWIAWSTKLSVDASGYGKAGPVRSPFTHVPDVIKKAAELKASKWRELVEKYSK